MEMNMKHAALKKKDVFVNNDPYAVPATFKCKWVKEMLGLTENEMALALNISYRTLANWLNDPADEAALDNVRFDRLLRLVGAAQGVIRADSLERWIHRPKKDLGDLIPVYLLGDENGYKKVYGILENVRHGVID